MTELFQQIPPPFNMVVIIVLICTVGGLITSIAKQIRKFAAHREDLELKREMLDRGLSAEEIERIIKAGSEKSSSGFCGE